MSYIENLSYLQQHSHGWLYTTYILHILHQRSTHPLNRSISVHFQRRVLLSHFQFSSTKRFFSWKLPPKCIEFLWAGRLWKSNSESSWRRTLCWVWIGWAQSFAHTRCRRRWMWFWWWSRVIMFRVGWGGVVRRRVWVRVLRLHMSMTTLTSKTCIIYIIIIAHDYKLINSSHDLICFWWFF